MRLLRAGPSAGPGVDFVDGLERTMAWLKGKLDWMLPARLSSPPEPGLCVPDDLPVHSPEVIERLAGEMPAQADAFRYRDNFARLVPERIERLTAGIRSNDPEEILATLLTLSVGSTMVGAARLHYVVDQCLTQVRDGRRTNNCLPFLVQEADRFLSYLADVDGVAPEFRGAVPSTVVPAPSPAEQAFRPPASSGSPHRGPS